MTCRALVLAVLVSTLAPAAPPPPDVSGTWRVKMDGETRRRPDGSTTTLNEMQATMVLTQKGSDLIGELTVRDSWKLTGRVDDSGRLQLTSERRGIPFTNNGKQGTTQARWVLHGVLAGGTLSGTAALEIEDREPTPRKWSGQR